MHEPPIIPRAHRCNEEPSGGPLLVVIVMAATAGLLVGLAVVLLFSYLTR